MRRYEEYFSQKNKRKREELAKQAMGQIWVRGGGEERKTTRRYGDSGSGPSEARCHGSMAQPCDGMKNYFHRKISAKEKSLRSKP